MDEIEVPIDKVHESLLEEVEREIEKKSAKWISWVALSSAVIAVAASVAALQAGHHSNEALIEQIQASDKWAYYQAKGIKASVLASKAELLEETGHKLSAKDLEKIEQYKTDQEQISKQAKEKELVSQTQLQIHETFAQSVTFFQIAIAIAAIAILIKRKRFWYLSLAFGAFGFFYLVHGFLIKIGDNING